MSEAELIHRAIVRALRRDVVNAGVHGGWVEELAAAAERGDLYKIKVK
jgi:hypothetical protein